MLSMMKIDDLVYEFLPSERDRHVKAMVATLKEDGVIVPIIVRQVGKKVVLVDGHSRLKAALLLRQAAKGAKKGNDWSKIPVINYGRITFEEAKKKSIIANVARRVHNFVEHAEFILELRALNGSEFNSDAAFNRWYGERIAKDEKVVRQLIAIATLSPEIRKTLRTNHLYKANRQFSDKAKWQDKGLMAENMEFLKGLTNQKFFAKERSKDVRKAVWDVDKQKAVLEKIVAKETDNIRVALADYQMGKELDGKRPQDFDKKAKDYFWNIDSTTVPPENFNRLPKKIDAIISDPPYGIKAKMSDGKHQGRLIKGDESLESAVAVTVGALRQAQPFLQKDAQLLIFGKWDPRFAERFASAIEESIYWLPPQKLDQLFYAAELVKHKTVRDVVLKEVGDNPIAYHRLNFLMEPDNVNRIFDTDELIVNELVRKGYCRSGWRFRTMISWDKVDPGKGTNQAALAQQEIILHFTRDARPLAPAHGDRYVRQVLRYPRVEETFENSKHMTEKPLWLMRYLIRTYTYPNNLVYDPFAGSAATLKAAKQLGRLYAGCQYDPENDPKSRIYLSALKDLVSTKASSKLSKKDEAADKPWEVETLPDGKRRKFSSL